MRGYAGLIFLQPAVFFRPLLVRGTGEGGKRFLSAGSSQGTGGMRSMGECPLSAAERLCGGDAPKEGRRGRDEGREAGVCAGQT